jgi:hypothetical protein
MRRIEPCLAALVALCFVGTPNVAGDVLHMNAKAVYEAAVSDGVLLSGAEDAIILASGVLVEDDGPAAGYSYLPNVERLNPSLRLRKQLLVERPAARAATLLVSRGGDLKVWVNGSQIQLPAPQRVGNYWQAYEIDPLYLRPGINDFTFAGSGSLTIARAEDFASGSLDRPQHPGRSFKSRDGGQTWQQNLGSRDDVQGEYYVRLFLDQHQPTGTLLLDVIDTANLSRLAVAPPLPADQPIRVTIAAEQPPGTSVILRYRTANTINPEAPDWSPWQNLEALTATLPPSSQRFVQFAIDISTSDPLATPRIRSVTITSTTERSDRDWWHHVHVVEQQNPRVVRSSIPFRYEPFDRPELAQLRREHDLDRVVQGAASELELITRLAAWTSHRWRRGHLGESYPPWNALEILKPHADGTPVGGFCLQYNLVFMQACASFGLAGRVVSLGQGNRTTEYRSGHEVVEIWSNELAKWVFIDADRAWYPADEISGQPLSLLELRQHQLNMLAGQAAAPLKHVRLTDLPHPWSGPGQLPPFLELRLVPRSNFLEQPAPLPLNQGMQGWSWNGHAVWTDEQFPAGLIYGLRVTDPRNFQWTLNQAHYRLEALVSPWQLRVHLDTHTPGFETFVAAMDDGEAVPVGSSILWALKPGLNRMSVWPRNIAGRDGIPSSVIVKYEPAD